ncbi:unnamed protein product [Medioppia subpectinata]|uniref:Uncharacterized protein n=1 Tax=Medioppia subpectinata TaxID=1979941 RepID=A0A7R9PY88_9ACAR|nr:unnamed protein product [Medioppia subpectinata]CAG2105645.1 unnamed protein product [Medioppia subpectinata]
MTSSLFDVYPCITDKVQGVPQCGPDALESTLSFIRSTTGNTVDAFCSDYTDGSDKCAKLDRPPKKLKSQRRSRSFAIPFIAAVRSIPEA